LVDEFRKDIRKAWRGLDVAELAALARALNELPDGFYFEGERFNRASVSTQGYNGAGPYTFHITRPTFEGEKGDTFTRGLAPSGCDQFTDAYGRSVCASRRKS